MRVKVIQETAAGVDGVSEATTTKPTRAKGQRRDLHLGTIYYYVPYKALLGLNHVSSII